MKDQPSSYPFKDVKKKPLQDVTEEDGIAHGYRIDPDLDVFTPTLRSFRPKILALYEGGTIPTIDAFDVLDFPTIIPHLFFLDLIFDENEKPIDGMFRMVGSLITKMFEVDVTGVNLSEIENQLSAQRFWLASMGALETRRPVRGYGKVTNPKFDFFLAEAIAFPLRRDNSDEITRIGAVLLAHNWAEYETTVGGT